MVFIKELIWVVGLLIMMFLSIIGVSGLLMVASPFLICYGLYALLKDVFEMRRTKNKKVT